MKTLKDLTPGQQFKFVGKKTLNTVINKGEFFVQYEGSKGGFKEVGYHQKEYYRLVEVEN